MVTFWDEMEHALRELLEIYGLTKILFTSGVEIEKKNKTWLSGRHNNTFWTKNDPAFVNYTSLDLVNLERRHRGGKSDAEKTFTIN